MNCGRFESNSKQHLWNSINLGEFHVIYSLDKLCLVARNPYLVCSNEVLAFGAFILELLLGP